ncbi:glycosyltransferase family 2 protein [Treponema sp. OMZ 787]|uniref:glycosyltransferase family 2 protein n=1 Tax=Treponema sp. OMZ 787 TaxID=2563669 RepID=UPI0020A25609|nr:glycosyltransferase family A protein [Treponema sp. OMZ 787]UTC61836.1 glycosyltransferase family 2 protein [Treponema sp. OMZ 787]
MLPLISLSVPVYGTESTLPALLDSILEQQPLPANAAGRGALPIEILIVNDGSPGGSSLPKILKPYKKKFKSLGVPLILLQHRKNQGLFEARRTAALAAQGEWVCCIDSDDTLPPDALLNFYEGLLASGSGNLDNAADIVHGKMAVTLHGSDKIAPEAYQRFEQKAKIVRLIFNGHLSGDEILDNFLIKKGHNGFLCAKLFRTSILRSVYEKLPHTYCINAENLLLYFFILLEKPSYYGIDKVVYNYSQDSGITSANHITSLERWEKVCSTSSVFTLIFSYIDEHPFPEHSAPALIRELRAICNTYLATNLGQLKHLVTPSLQVAAYAMLCDYWGEDYVKQIEILKA